MDKWTRPIVSSSRLSEYVSGMKQHKFLLTAAYNHLHGDDNTVIYICMSFRDWTTEFDTDSEELQAQTCSRVPGRSRETTAPRQQWRPNMCRLSSAKTGSEHQQHKHSWLWQEHAPLIFELLPSFMCFYIYHIIVSFKISLLLNFLFIWLIYY